MKLDPDPGFGPNLDPYPGLNYQFLKKFKKSIFLHNFKNKISPKEIFKSVESLNCEFMH